MTPSELEKEIEVAALMLGSCIPERRRYWYDRLLDLKAQRSPQTVKELEREQMQRARGR